MEQAVEREAPIPPSRTESDPEADRKRCREILESLAALTFDPTNVPETLRSLRNVRTQVESLSAMDPGISSALLEFLQTGRDVHYPVYLYAAGRLAPADPKDAVEDSGDFLGRRELKPTNDLLAFAFPPSVRIAILEVLIRFRNPEVLGKILQLAPSFKLGAELAFCDRMWLESGGDSNQRNVFRNRAVQLLGEPTMKVPNEDLLLTWQPQYLLGLTSGSGGSVLHRALASNRITSDSSVDLNLLDESVSRLGAAVVPLLRQTFEDPRLTDVRHRGYVAGLATDYYGIDDAANEFVKLAIKDDSLPQELKFMLIQSLNGYNMFTKKYVPVTPESMAVRVNLLDKLKSPSSGVTPTIQQAIEMHLRSMKFKQSLP